MFDLTDKQLKTLRDRAEPGLRQAATHPPRNILDCLAYVALSHMAMAIDREIEKRAEQPTQQAKK